MARVDEESVKRALLAEEAPPREPKTIKEESGSGGVTDSIPASAQDFAMVVGRWVGQVRDSIQAVGFQPLLQDLLEV